MKQGIIVLLIIIFFVGGLAGYLLSGSFKKVSISSSGCLEKYTYINPLLGCDFKYFIKKTGYAQLKYEIGVYLNSQKSEGKITGTSVYFRDLVNGPWFGINEHDDFIPASLLKLPIMLTYLKMAEDDPPLTFKKLTINRLPKDVEEQYIKPEKSVSVGETYTVEELLERMIVYSDNHASGFLIDHLYSTSEDKDPLITTLRETGTITSFQKPLDEISVKSYASLFRLLFNSSYLSFEMSDKALGFLSEAKFDQGIVGGVPKEMKVAHKFGEREIDGELNQLHDCGIVYFPKNPYILCVMTRGKDFNDLSKVIQEVSGMVYKEVKSREI